MAIGFTPRIKPGDQMVALALREDDGLRIVVEGFTHTGTTRVNARSGKVRAPEHTPVFTAPFYVVLVAKNRTAPFAIGFIPMANDNVQLTQDTKTYFECMLIGVQGAKDRLSKSRVAHNYDEVVKAICGLVNAGTFGNANFLLSYLNDIPTVSWESFDKAIINPVSNIKYIHRNEVTFNGRDATKTSKAITYI